MDVRHATQTAVYVSADMEGCADVVHWDEVRPAAHDAYRRARRVLLAEVNSVLAGAFEGGAVSAVVNDAHGAMRNICGEGVDPRARVVTGHSKPLYMLEGVTDLPFPAMAFFVGYHGAVHAGEAVLAHTYSPRLIFACRLNGVPAGEVTLNAALAGHFGIPVTLVSGDQATLAEAARVVPWAVGVETKRSLGYYAAICLSEREVCEQLRAAAGEAVHALARSRPYRVNPPVEVAIDTLTTAQADVAELLPGVRRAGGRSVVLCAPDMPAAYRLLRALLALNVAISP
jgi:D-amino peptidase